MPRTDTTHGPPPPTPAPGATGTPAADSPALTCRRFAGQLRRALAGLGRPETAVAVRELGIRDAYAPGAQRYGGYGGEPGDGCDGADTGVPVALYGRHAVVGPLPGARACPHCLARRWQGVRSLPLREALELGSGTRAVGASPYVTPFAVDALASLIAAELDRDRPRGAGPYDDVWLVDLQTLTVRGYPLVPDPECPRCAHAEPDSADRATLRLGPAPKHRPGASRVREIGSYDLPTEPWTNPLCGALGPSVVYDVSSTSTSATIGCFTMRAGDYLRETFWGGHADTFGESVRVGILEGLERYAGMRARGAATVVRDSLDGLTARGERVVDPREVGLYSPEFHEANPRVAPFTTDREIPWVWGYSLRDERPVLVPEVLSYYHSPGLENRFVQESSNGCASGGSLEEAVYFGLMEVVERDAFLLTWYGRAALPEIDPRSSTRRATREMVDRLEMYGYEARFFDTRISFRSIPVVTGVAVRHDGGPGRMCFGAGAGLDPESAMAGALCEIATDSVNLPERLERDHDKLHAMAADFDKVTALHDHPLVYGVPEMGRHAEFLIGAPGEPRRPARSMAETFGDGSVPALSDDVHQDLRACLEAVTGAGFDVVVVDQTMPEQRRLGLNTVSVMVPGLLPIDFGWSRQRALRMPRMRTALRAAGLRERELEPDDLNPAPHPFP
ncbi:MULTISPECIES: TOMM precursor leader peptide-binding protein [unclassified Streptomyces]|uniref:TOMM precursor leader peptide-binding protein n=1 Tax=unclassified Streptomyces TaxID=2593676 RepID=UPI000CD56BC6|nr:MULTISPECIES: TOMM precursor leader peptide-binding protein [unclassified Streptomyces]